MYKKQYDEEKIKLRSKILVYNSYPNLDHEPKIQMAESEEWLELARRSFVLEELADKIYKQHMGILTKIQSQHMANNIVNDMPEELWPNIEEWIDDKPISDIKVHGVSVPQIMHQFPEMDIEVLSAIKCISRWKMIDYQCDDFCKMYFMRM